MLALKWHDKSDVCMLSTVHDSSIVSIGKRNFLTGGEILKPLCVTEYNQNKRGAEKCKMYKRLFSHMIDVSVLNAYILFKNIRQQHIQLSKCKLEVIRG